MRNHFQRESTTKDQSVARAGRRIRLLGIFAVVAFGALGLRPSEAQREAPPNFFWPSEKWFVQWLGNLPNGMQSIATDVAANGKVSGTAIDMSGIAHAFRFSNFTLTDLTPTNWGNSGASAINDSGQVAGIMYVETTNGWEKHAVRFSGGSQIDLGHLSGGRDSSAYGINNQGDVVGDAEVQPNVKYHAFLWKPSTGMVSLGTLGGNEARDRGINDSGEVAGWSELYGTDDFHAFRYASGTMSDAGTLAGPMSVAHRINNSGQMVGWANLAWGNYHACLWNKGYAPRDIDHRTGWLNSEAIDINSSGVIVGTAEFGVDDERAVQWTYNQSTGQYDMLDLNSVLPGGSDMKLLAARGINDNGQIAGWGFTGYKKQAFLLTPVRVKSLQLGASTAIGGNSVLGVVELTNLPPVDVSVGLSTTNPAVVVPASVTVEAHLATGGFIATTVPVSSTTLGSVRASLGFLNSAAASLTVRPPGVKTLVLDPISVQGGSTSVARITLEKAAGPGGVVVTITSSKPAEAWPTQSSISIPQGSTSAAMTIHTAAPASLKPKDPLEGESPTSVTIVASANNIARSATLRVLAP